MSRLTAKDQILIFLRSDSKHEYKVSELAYCLELPESTVRGAVKRLWQQGQVNSRVFSDATYYSHKEEL